MRPLEILIKVSKLIPNKGLKTSMYQRLQSFHRIHFKKNLSKFRIRKVKNNFRIKFRRL